MTPYLDLLPEVLPEVPGCSDTLAEREIRSAVMGSSLSDQGAQKGLCTSTATEMLSAIPIQNKDKCMEVFKLVGLERYFQLPPCKVDPKRFHELRTTLKEDGTYHLTNKNGEIVEVKISGPMVSTTLLIKEGNHQYSNMKLNKGITKRLRSGSLSSLRTSSPKMELSRTGTM